MPLCESKLKIPGQLLQRLEMMVADIVTFDQLDVTIYENYHKHFPTSSDASKLDLIDCAFLTGNEKVIERVLSKRPDIKIDCDLLDKAFCLNSTAAVKCILKHNQFSSRRDLFSRAAYFGSGYEIARYLLEEFNLTRPAEGKLIPVPENLHIAIKRNRLDVVWYLMRVHNVQYGSYYTGSIFENPSFPQMMRHMIQTRNPNFDIDILNLISSTESKEDLQLFIEQTHVHPTAETLSVTEKNKYAEVREYIKSIIA